MDEQNGSEDMTIAEKELFQYSRRKYRCIYLLSFLVGILTFMGALVMLFLAGVERWNSMYVTLFIGLAPLLLLKSATSKNSNRVHEVARLKNPRVARSFVEQAAILEQLGPEHERLLSSYKLFQFVAISISSYHVAWMVFLFVFSLNLFKGV